MTPTLRRLSEKTSAIERPKPKPPLPPPQPPVYFSFAAYAKTLIQHLRSLNVDVLPGLTDHEISAVESSLRFSFPSDLRSILQAGLPVGTHFPNWRVWSTQQLLVLFNLPAFYLSKSVARRGFWVRSWGPRPENDAVAQSLIKKLLDHAPILVPVYANCYVPSTTPNLAGNPVFQVDGNGVRILSFDVSGFFERLDRFSQMGDVNVINGYTSLIGCDRRINALIPAAWAATEARRVEFWTDAAEKGGMTEARGPPRGWWSVMGCMRVRACLEDTIRRLRGAGWKEDEVREMMMDGHDENSDGTHVLLSTVDVDVVRRRIRGLSQVLSRAGWSREDVVYSLDLGEEDTESNGCDRKDDEHRESCKEGVHQVRGEVTTLMQLLSLEA